MKVCAMSGYLADTQAQKQEVREDRTYRFVPLK